MQHIALKKVSVGDPPPLEGAKDVVYYGVADITMFLITGGMQSGKSSVFFVIDTPDGKKLALETSLAVLANAVKGLEAMDAVGF